MSNDLLENIAITGGMLSRFAGLNETEQQRDELRALNAELVEAAELVVNAHDFYTKCQKDKNSIANGSLCDAEGWMKYVCLELSEAITKAKAVQP